MEEVNVDKDFRSFRVSLCTGSRAKKRMSNHVKIFVPTDRAEVSVSLTTREARALQSFLAEYLGE